MSVSEITETRQYLTFKLGNSWNSECVCACKCAAERDALSVPTGEHIPAQQSLQTREGMCK